jgi:hypothetical protein
MIRFLLSAKTSHDTESRFKLWREEILERREPECEDEDPEDEFEDEHSSG